MSSVISSAAAGTIYVGPTCCGGWGSNVVLAGGNVTFSTPCFFVAQLSSGVVTAIEVDRQVTATVQANPPQLLAAYTPVTFGGPPLPTGLLQSTPLGQAGAFSVIYQEAGSAASANGDGTTGWQTPSSGPQISGWTVLQIWWTAPASQYYQFKVPSRCTAFTANPANSLAISLDQVPLQYDSATTGNNNWFMAFVSNTGATSIEYSFTAAVTAGVHSILIYLCNGAHFGTGALNNVTHFDRLNIYGTGTPLPAEPLPQTRNPALQPYSSFHFMNVPFGANAQFRALNDPVSQTLNGTGGNGASVSIGAQSFSSNIWIGTAADPVWSLTSPDVSGIPTSPVGTPIPCRVPAGAYPSLDSSDKNVAFIDGTNPRYAYAGIEWFQNGPRTANYDLGIVDSYNLNHGVPQGFGNLPGLIRVYDCNNGVIAHRLLGHMGFPPTQVGGVFTSAPGGYAPAIQSSQWSGMPWPACQSDSAWKQANEYNNPNGVPYGAVAGIRPGIVKPVGLNAATSMMWDCLANYGVWFNVTGGTYPGWGIYAEGAATNHPALTGISWGTILPNLAVMTTASQAPIIVGQGLGGGAPKVGLAPGLTQGYPSIGQSPYTFPSSPVGIPLQIAHSNPGVALPSNTATTSPSFGPTVPVGSFVIAFFCLDRAAAVNFNTPLFDSRGNSYIVINSPSNASTWHPVIAYCISTTVALGSGTSWTPVLSPSGSANYFSLGVYYRPASAGTTSLRVSNSVATSSNVTTLSTSLAGVQVGDVIFDIALASNYSVVTQQAGLNSLCPVPPMDIGFRIATAADVGTKVISPTFSIATPAALVAAAFTTTSTLVQTMTQSSTANNFHTYNLGPGGSDVGTDGPTPYNACNNAADGGAVWSYSMGFYTDFPNHTTWTWTTSKASGASNGNPLSYQELAYGFPGPGCLPGGVHPPTPMHPSDFAAANVTLTFNLSFSALGNANDIDWLIETWPCTNSSPPFAPGCLPQATSGVTDEVGFFTYGDPGLLSFAQSGTHNFDATLSDGMNIRVYTQSGGTAAPFRMMFPVTTPGGNTLVNLCDGNTHTIRMGEIIGLLASNSVISNSTFIVGFDFGPETYAGSGSAVANIYQWNNWPFT